MSKTNCSTCAKTLEPGINISQKVYASKHYRCDACTLLYNQLWRHRHQRSVHRKSYTSNAKRLGIQLTYEEKEAKTAEQNGLCAICKRPPGKRALHADHNHETLQVRDLLCTRCNRDVGILEGPMLPRYLAYLEKWKSN